MPMKFAPAIKDIIRLASMIEAISKPEQSKLVFGQVVEETDYLKQELV